MQSKSPKQRAIPPLSTEPKPRNRRRSVVDDDSEHDDAAPSTISLLVQGGNSHDEMELKKRRLGGSFGSTAAFFGRCPSKPAAGQLSTATFRAVRRYPAPFAIHLLSLDVEGMELEFCGDWGCTSTALG